MKSESNLKSWSWLLALCFVSALVLAACESTSEHPSKHEHPQKQQPATNAPPRNP